MFAPILAIATAVLFGGAQGWKKHLTSRHPARLIVFAAFGAALPFVAALALLLGPEAPRAGFWTGVAGSVSINVVAQLILVRALADQPISIVAPYLAWTPVFLTATAWLILGESPTVLGVSGSVLVAAGAYLLHVPGGPSTPLEPLRQAIAHPGSRLALLVAFLWSFTASFDKQAVLASSPVTYALAFHLIFPLVMALILLPAARTHGRSFVKDGGAFLFLGAMQAGIVCCQLTAIEVLPVQTVIAVKRAGAIVAVVLGFLYFEEKEALKRLPGTALMVAGAVAVLMA